MTRCSGMARGVAERPMAQWCRLIAVSLALLALLPMWPAQAQPESAADAPLDRDPPSDDEASRQAKERFQRGVQALQQAQWERAEKLLAESLELVPRASTAYNLALARVQQGKGTMALAVLEHLPESGRPPSASAVKELRAQALAQVAEVQLVVRPSTARVEVDDGTVRGEAAERRVWLDPGLHQLQVSADGFAPLELHLDVSAGQHVARSIVLQEVPPAPEASATTPSRKDVQDPDAPEPVPQPSGVVPLPAKVERRHRALVSLAVVGGLVSVAGAAVGGRALRLDADFKEQCPQLVCGDAQRQELSPLATRVRRQALATDVLLAVGGASLVGALTVYLFNRAAAPGWERQRVAWSWRGGAGVQVTGRW